MKVRIIFKSKYACEKDWSDGECNQALYEKDKAALVDWKRSHKIIRYLIPLVETALVLTAIWFFGFHALPPIFHRYYDAGDFDMGFRSSLMAVICFLGILPFAMKLLGMLLRKLNLKGPAVPEPPRWRDLELKYERYTLIQPLLTSDENTPIAIAAAASFGFRSVRNQDTSADPDFIILDFDREQIMIPTQAAREPDEPEPGE
ncbi:hypothetical protein [Oscillibacter sp.]|uniref:hypothetical protein n=1 Tax=Oscillibacter sp. TaxID=1945593 RepID=UPI0028A7DEC0|nr:hypothetical protein [Oscillibacter sp.]